MTWGWLCGWSIDREAFHALCRKHLPHAEHRVEAPTRAGRDRLLAGGVEIHAGYSLGAWLLLDAAAHGWRPPRPVRLLAPFLSFPAEADRGGRVRRTQLRWVARMLATDPEAAVLDFSVRAGLTAPTTHPPVRDEIAEGIEHLQDTRLPALPAAAADWTAFAGALDSLVDAVALARYWPGLRIVPNAGHDPAPLLAAMFEEENSAHAF